MVGKIIRELRKQQSMTLEELAKQVGISSGGLSQIERDLVDPSLAVLKRIATALNVSLYVLFTEENGSYISRATERKKAIFSDMNVEYEFLTPRPRIDSINPKIEVTRMTMKPHAWSSETYQHHDADECFVVVKGIFEIYMPDSEPIILEEDDSMYLTEGVTHRVYNPTNRDSIAISILSKIIY